MLELFSEALGISPHKTASKKKKKNTLCLHRQTEAEVWTKSGDLINMENQKLGHLNSWDQNLTPPLTVLYLIYLF